MARARKRHVQLELPKLDKNGQRRGGARPRAGRKPNGERPGSPHKQRDEVNPRHVQHVTVRVVEALEWLRKPHAYRAIRAALVTMLARHVDFRIVHFSLQGNHVHLLCEAENKLALTRGAQGFQISAARQLNREISERRGKQRRGRVFADRYHVETIDSPRQMRHALAYVLNNWRRHKQDSGVGLYNGRIDPFSSGVWFLGWKERTGPITIPPGYDAPQMAPPNTWLLAESWKLLRPISVFEVPGTR